ncbi:hypothetical protein QJQ45_007270 [Haematococcus lacustris]|nr:hypothetical protein QJQ45_007270 [Haematococcus lacustris]
MTSERQPGAAARSSSQERHPGAAARSSSQERQPGAAARSGIQERQPGGAAARRRSGSQEEPGGAAARQSCPTTTITSATPSESPLPEGQPWAGSMERALVVAASQPTLAMP